MHPVRGRERQTDLERPPQTPGPRPGARPGRPGIRVCCVGVGVGVGGWVRVCARVCVASAGPRAVRRADIPLRSRWPPPRRPRPGALGRGAARRHPTSSLAAAVRRARHRLQILGWGSRDSDGPPECLCMGASDAWTHPSQHGDSDAWTHPSQHHDGDSDAWTHPSHHGDSDALTHPIPSARSPARAHVPQHGDSDAGR